eukprot:4184688-Pyramimonas_sp.AAC.1
MASSRWKRSTSTTPECELGASDQGQVSELGKQAQAVANNSFEQAVGGAGGARAKHRERVGRLQEKKRR